MDLALEPRWKASSTMLLTGAKPVAPATKTIGRSDSRRLKSPIGPSKRIRRLPSSPRKRAS
jgi:hypothetical protein